VYVAGAEDLCKAPEWLLRERQRLFHPFLANEASAAAFFQQNDRVLLEGTEAGTTPLFPLRSGRPAADGANLNLEFQFAAQAGRDDGLGIALGVTPGFALLLADYSSLTGRFYLQEAYAKIGYGWWELTFGRLQRQFGDSRHGTLLLSRSARPMDSLEIALRPHVLGTPFGFLGPFSFRIFAGNLDKSAFVSGAKLGGLEISLRPTRGLELAWMELYQFGGTGVAPLEPADLLKLLIYSADPALDAKRSRSSVFQISLREPKTHGKLYLQTYFEGYTGEVSALAGVYFPKVGSSDLRFEAAYTAEHAYQHPTYRQGLTREGLPLGHPLGPDALGGYLDLGFPLLTSWRGEVGAFAEARDRHPAAGVATEVRYGGGLSLRRHWQSTSFSLEGRYGYLQGAQYLPGQTNSVLSVQSFLSYSFF
jgi:hypothetical protein